MLDVADPSLGIDLQIHDVRQRTFAVTTKTSRKHILRTGYIGPCVAFYGVNDKGVAFMAHLDGSIGDSHLLTARLMHETKKDLSGFSLYFTTNYFLLVRLTALAMIVCSYKFFPSLNLCIWLALLACAADWCFRSIALVYLYSYRTFKTVRVMPREPDGFGFRVEVSVDAALKSGPARPSIEKISGKESFKNYRPPNNKKRELTDLSPCPPSQF